LTRVCVVERLRRCGGRTERPAGK